MPKIIRYRERLRVVSYRVMLDVPRELVLFVSGLLAAHRHEPKVISQMLGHTTVAFTMDVYTEVAEELAEAAAEAIAAFIPRRGQPGMGS